MWKVGQVIESKEERELVDFSNDSVFIINKGDRAIIIDDKHIEWISGAATGRYQLRRDEGFESV